MHRCTYLWSVCLSYCLFSSKLETYVQCFVHFFNIYWWERITIFSNLLLWLRSCLLLIFFGIICLYGGKKYLGPGGLIYRNLTQGQVQKILMSSKIVRTHNYICRFLCRSLGLKMHPNAGKMPGKRSECKKTKIWQLLKGGPFDCCDFENFLYICIEPIIEDEPNPCCF